jgi:hypothetical protein
MVGTILLCPSPASAFTTFYIYKFQTTGLQEHYNKIEREEKGIRVTDEVQVTVFK